MTARAKSASAFAARLVERSWTPARGSACRPGRPAGFATRELPVVIVSIRAPEPRPASFPWIACAMVVLVAIGAVIGSIDIDWLTSVR